MTNSDWVPTAEASRISGLSTSALVRRARSGALRTAAKAPGLRGAYFFHRSDIEALAHASGRLLDLGLMEEPSVRGGTDAVRTTHAPPQAVAV